MEKEKIDRINHLARKHRCGRPHEEEKAEQQRSATSTARASRRDSRSTSTACITKCRTAALSRQCRAR